MNRIILQLFALGFCFAIGHTLKCYSCKFGVGTLCITTEITCKDGEHCYSGQGEAVGFVPITRRGCLESSKCNKTSDVDLPASTNSTIYTMTKTCCNTDLCNAAPGLPGASRLSLALASVGALLVANWLI